jgi:hypothetical protein
VVCELYSPWKIDYIINAVNLILLNSLTTIAFISAAHAELICYKNSITWIKLKIQKLMIMIISKGNVLMLVLEARSMLIALKFWTTARTGLSCWHPYGVLLVGLPAVSLSKNQRELEGFLSLIALVLYFPLQRMPFLSIL